jgi:hypothetical protein
MRKIFIILIPIISIIFSSCSNPPPTSPASGSNQTQVFSYPDSVYIEWSGGAVDSFWTYPSSYSQIMDTLHLNSLKQVRLTFESHVWNPYEHNDSAGLHFEFWYLDSNKSLIDITKYDSLNFSFDHTFNCSFYKIDSTGHTQFWYSPSGTFSSQITLNRQHNSIWHFPHRYFYIKNIKLFRID